MAQPGGGLRVARDGAQPNQQPGQPQQSVGSRLFGFLRVAIFWYFAMQFFSGKKSTTGNPALLMENLFSKGEPVDLWMYLSESESFSDFGKTELLVWHQVNIPYADWTPAGVRNTLYTYHPSESVQNNNGSVYAHVYFTRSGYSPDPRDNDYEKLATFYARHPLVTHRPKPKVNNRVNLLGSDVGDKRLPTQTEEVGDGTGMEVEGQAEWVSLWKPNMTINLVEDFTRYARGKLPPTVSDYLLIDEITGNYYPTVFFNEFWLLRDKFILINETVKELPLEISFGPISVTRWQLYLQIDQSFQIHQSYGSMLDGESDELKRVFLEGNPVLLVVTMAVSLLHTVFDFLAFKNDIQFWNKNKSMEGLSARSVVINFSCQLIVFLYLMDNETSWMILISAGVGCCIEFWKIGKAMHIEIDYSRGYPMLTFRDRESYAGNKTKEYDDMAMKYLSYALYPIVACFAIYSLMYEQHKSWYSWILSSLTSCVYTLGFIMMCPQLFINYKLKSVAHLPWRQMTYKFLNTIIDDLFAFVIKMPWLHRLSVFRDDVVFLVYLYQRWVYPVDRKRTNEFGYGGADGTGVEAVSGSEAVQAIEGTDSSTSQRAVGEDRIISGTATVQQEGLRRTGAGMRVDEGGVTASASESESDKKTL